MVAENQSVQSILSDRWTAYQIQQTDLPNLIELISQRIDTIDSTLIRYKLQVGGIGLILARSLVHQNELSKVTSTFGDQLNEHQSEHRTMIKKLMFLFQNSFTRNINDKAAVARIAQKLAIQSTIQSFDEEEVTLTAYELCPADEILCTQPLQYKLQITAVLEYVKSSQAQSPIVQQLTSRLTKLLQVSSDLAKFQAIKQQTSERIPEQLQQKVQMLIKDAEKTVALTQGFKKCMCCVVDAASVYLAKSVAVGKEPTDITEQIIGFRHLCPIEDFGNADSWRAAQCAEINLDLLTKQFNDRKIELQTLVLDLLCNLIQTMDFSIEFFNVLKIFEPILEDRIVSVQYLVNDALFWSNEQRLLWTSRNVDNIDDYNEFQQFYDSSKLQKSIIGEISMTTKMQTTQLNNLEQLDRNLSSLFDEKKQQTFHYNQQLLKKFDEEINVNMDQMINMMYDFSSIGQKMYIIALKFYETFKKRPDQIDLHKKLNDLRIPEMQQKLQVLTKQSLFQIQFVQWKVVHVIHKKINQIFDQQLAIFAKSDKLNQLESKCQLLLQQQFGESNMQFMRHQNPNEYILRYKNNQSQLLTFLLQLISNQNLLKGKIDLIIHGNQDQKSQKMYQVGSTKSFQSLFGTLQNEVKQQQKSVISCCEEIADCIRSSGFEDQSQQIQRACFDVAEYYQTGALAMIFLLLSDQIQPIALIKAIIEEQLITFNPKIVCIETILTSIIKLLQCTKFWSTAQKQRPGPEQKITDYIVDLIPKYIKDMKAAQDYHLSKDDHVLVKGMQIQLLLVILQSQEIKYSSREVFKNFLSEENNKLLQRSVDSSKFATLYDIFDPQQNEVQQFLLSQIILKFNSLVDCANQISIHFFNQQKLEVNQKIQIIHFQRYPSIVQTLQQISQNVYQNIMNTNNKQMLNVFSSIKVKDMMINKIGIFLFDSKTLFLKLQQDKADFVSSQMSLFEEEVKSIKDYINECLTSYFQQVLSLKHDIKIRPDKLPIICKMMVLSFDIRVSLKIMNDINFELNNIVQELNKTRDIGEFSSAKFKTEQKKIEQDISEMDKILDSHLIQVFTYIVDQHQKHIELFSLSFNIDIGHLTENSIQNHNKVLMLLEERVVKCQILFNQLCQFEKMKFILGIQKGLKFDNSFDNNTCQLYITKQTQQYDVASLFNYIVLTKQLISNYIVFKQHYMHLFALNVSEALKNVNQYSIDFRSAREKLQHCLTNRNDTSKFIKVEEEMYSSEQCIKILEKVTLLNIEQQTNLFTFLNISLNEDLMVKLLNIDFNMIDQKINELYDYQISAHHTECEINSIANSITDSFQSNFDTIVTYIELNSEIYDKLLEKIKVNTDFCNSFHQNYSFNTIIGNTQKETICCQIISQIKFLMSIETYNNLNLQLLKKSRMDEIKNILYTIIIFHVSLVTFQKICNLIIFLDTCNEAHEKIMKLQKQFTDIKIVCKDVKKLLIDDVNKWQYKIQDVILFFNEILTQQQQIMNTIIHSQKILQCDTEIKHVYNLMVKEQLNHYDLLNENVSTLPLSLNNIVDIINSNFIWESTILNGAIINWFADIHGFDQIISSSQNQYKYFTNICEEYIESNQLQTTINDQQLSMVFKSTENIDISYSLLRCYLLFEAGLRNDVLQSICDIRRLFNIVPIYSTSFICINYNDADNILMFLQQQNQNPINSTYSLSLALIIIINSIIFLGKSENEFNVMIDTQQFKYMLETIKQIKNGFIQNYEQKTENLQYIQQIPFVYHKLRIMQQIIEDVIENINNIKDFTNFQKFFDQFQQKFTVIFITSEFEMNSISTRNGLLKDVFIEDRNSLNNETIIQFVSGLPKPTMYLSLHKTIVSNFNKQTSKFVLNRAISKYLQQQFFDLIHLTEYSLIFSQCQRNQRASSFKVSLIDKHNDIIQLVQVEDYEIEQKFQYIEVNGGIDIIQNKQNMNRIYKFSSFLSYVYSLANSVTNNTSNSNRININPTLDQLQLGIEALDESKYNDNNDNLMVQQLVAGMYQQPIHFFQNEFQCFVNQCDLGNGVIDILLLQNYFSQIYLQVLSIITFHKNNATISVNYEDTQILMICISFVLSFLNQQNHLDITYSINTRYNKKMQSVFQIGLLCEEQCLNIHNNIHDVEKQLNMFKIIISIQKWANYPIYGLKNPKINLLCKEYLKSKVFVEHYLKKALYQLIQKDLQDMMILFFDFFLQQNFEIDDLVKFTHFGQITQIIIGVLIYIMDSIIGNEQLSIQRPPKQFWTNIIMFVFSQSFYIPNLKCMASKTRLGIKDSYPSCLNCKMNEQSGYSLDQSSWIGLINKYIQSTYNNIDFGESIFQCIPTINIYNGNEISTGIEIIKANSDNYQTPQLILIIGQLYTYNSTKMNVHVDIRKHLNNILLSKCSNVKGNLKNFLRDQIIKNYSGNKLKILSKANSCRSASVVSQKFWMMYKLYNFDVSQNIMIKRKNRISQDGGHEIISLLSELDQINMLQSNDFFIILTSQNSTLQTRYHSYYERFQTLLKSLSVNVAKIDQMWQLLNISVANITIEKQSEFIDQYLYYYLKCDANIDESKIVRIINKQNSSQDKQYLILRKQTSNIPENEQSITDSSLMLAHRFTSKSNLMLTSLTDLQLARHVNKLIHCSHTLQQNLPLTRCASCFSILGSHRVDQFCHTTRYLTVRTNCFANYVDSVKILHQLVSIPPPMVVQSNINKAITEAYSLIIRYRCMVRLILTANFASFTSEFQEQRFSISWLKSLSFQDATELVLLGNEQFPGDTLMNLDEIICGQLIQFDGCEQKVFELLAVTLVVDSESDIRVSLQPESLIQHLIHLDVSPAMHELMLVLGRCVPSELQKKFSRSTKIMIEHERIRYQEGCAFAQKSKKQVEIDLEKIVKENNQNALRHELELLVDHRAELSVRGNGINNKISLVEKAFAAQQLICGKLAADFQKLSDQQDLIATRTDILKTAYEQLLSQSFADPLALGLKWNIQNETIALLSVLIMQVLQCTSSRTKLQWLGEATALQFKKRTAMPDRLVRDMRQLTHDEAAASPTFNDCLNCLSQILRLRKTTLKVTADSLMFENLQTTEEFAPLNDLIELAAQAHQIAGVLVHSALIMIDRALLVRRSQENAASLAQSQKMLDTEQEKHDMLEQQLDELDAHQEQIQLDVTDTVAKIADIQQQLAQNMAKYLENDRLQLRLQNQLGLNTQLQQHNPDLYTQALTLAAIVYCGKSNAFHNLNKLSQFPIANTSLVTGEMLWKVFGYNKLQQIIDVAISQKFVVQSVLVQGHSYSVLNDRRVRDLSLQFNDEGAMTLMQKLGGDARGLEREMVREQLQFIPEQGLAVCAKALSCGDAIHIYCESVNCLQAVGRLVGGVLSPHFIFADNLPSLKCQIMRLNRFFEMRLGDDCDCVRKFAPPDVSDKEVKSREFEDFKRFQVVPIVTGISCEVFEDLLAERFKTHQNRFVYSAQNGKLSFAFKPRLVVMTSQLTADAMRIAPFELFEEAETEEQRPRFVRIDEGEELDIAIQRRHITALAVSVGGSAWEVDRTEEMICSLVGLKRAVVERE